MYTSRQTVHFFDADPAGVIFFSRIYNLCHAAYEEFLEDIGLMRTDLFLHPQFALPIIHSEADYFAPILAGESVDVHLEIPQLRTSSFELRSRIIGANGQEKANVSTIHVCVEKSGWKKHPLPDDWRKILARYVAVPIEEDSDAAE